MNKKHALLTTSLTAIMLAAYTGASAQQGGAEMPSADGAQQCNLAQVLANSTVDEALQAMDVNSDAAISWEEVQVCLDQNAAGDASAEASSEEVQIGFSQVDADQDQTATREELEMASQQKMGENQVDLEAEGAAEQKPTPLTPDQQQADSAAGMPEATAEGAGEVTDPADSGVDEGAAAPADRDMVNEESRRSAESLVASDVLGMSVIAASGDEVGEIDELLISKQDGILYAVVGVGGFFGIGDKDVLIETERFQIDSEQRVARLSMTEQELESMPALEERGNYEPIQPQGAM